MPAQPALPAKLSEPQRELLQILVNGGRLRHVADVTGGEWNFTNATHVVLKSTANRLADRGYIAPLDGDGLISDYRITDAGRAALNEAVSQ